MAVKNAGANIHTAVMDWPGVEAHPHRFGGVEYLLGARELGHIHGDHLVDIPFPTRVRDEVDRPEGIDIGKLRHRKRGCGNEVLEHRGVTGVRIV